MTLSRRAALLLLLLGLALLLGFFFRSFLLENFIRPVALVVLLLQRVVQSVDQHVYWYLLIASAVIYLFVRFALTLTAPPPETPAEPNVTLDSINQWRVLIPLSDEASDRPNILKQNLGRILTTIYSSREPDTVPWEVDEALRVRRIPLPESIHAFLVPAAPAEETSPVRRILRAVWRAPETLARRWTGRDADEYYRSVEEVIRYMEFSMEKKHDE
jgi:hypothetical protein